MKLIKLCLLVSLLSISNLTIAKVVVIVNVSNTATLSDNELSSLFLGKLKSFPNKKKAQAINLKYGNETRKIFEKSILKKTSSQVKAYWSKLLFSGKGKPLKELSSDAEVKAFVADNPNAIAYIDASNIDSSVKVIKEF
ncbi:MAG TPA: phosphate ABC transporter substrate-binding protein [Colwellia sp.]|nr:phosphate ABC transporter substrate-binding protein [Colwellia sp.]|tara:strand:- start:1309 stop:1725 length:417 start_codon:yes stop_codon:yes gene_type:complete